MSVDKSVDSVDYSRKKGKNYVNLCKVKNDFLKIKHSKNSLHFVTILTNELKFIKIKQ